MNPDDRIPVTLTAAQWNNIMQMLGEQPYRLVAGHITSIQAQCMSHEVNRVQETHASVSRED